MHTPYAVVRHTSNNSVTFRVLSNCVDLLYLGCKGGGRSSKLAAKSLVSSRTGWNGWTGPAPENRVFTKVCEPLITPGRSPALVRDQVVAGSSPSRLAHRGPWKREGNSAPQVPSPKCLQDWRGLQGTGGTAGACPVDSKCPDSLTTQRKACAVAGLGYPSSTGSSPVLLANRRARNRKVPGPSPFGP
jgi:hypothetical protein